MTRSKLCVLVVAATSLSKAGVAAAGRRRVDRQRQRPRPGEAVTVAGFGTFTVRPRAAGQGRNPVIGEPVAIAALRARLQARQGPSRCGQPERLSAVALTDRGSGDRTPDVKRAPEPGARPPMCHARTAMRGSWRSSVAPCYRRREDVVKRPV